jgi:hypothetical protein
MIGLEIEEARKPGFQVKEIAGVARTARAV